MTPLLPLRTMPSTAARESSSDVIVLARAVSNRTFPTIEPMRMDMLVDFEINEMTEATGTGSRVGPCAGVGEVRPLMMAGGEATYLRCSLVAEEIIKGGQS